MRNLGGGRVPPLTRTALLSGLGVFLLALLLFKPGSAARSQAPLSASQTLLLAPENPLVQRIILLDESTAYLPSFAGGRHNASEIPIRPEDTPFPFFSPTIRFVPGGRADLLPETDFTKTFEPLDSINLTSGEPFQGFGTTKPPVERISMRSFSCFLVPMDSPDGKKINIEVGDFPKINAKKAFKNDFIGYLGVDSLGILGKPGVIRSTGDALLDQEVLAWISRQPWGGKIAPGVYQVWVGP